MQTFRQTPQLTSSVQIVQLLSATGKTWFVQKIPEDVSTTVYYHNQQQALFGNDMILLTSFNHLSFIYLIINCKLSLTPDNIDIVNIYCSK